MLTVKPSRYAVNIGTHVKSEKVEVVVVVIVVVVAMEVEVEVIIMAIIRF